MKIFCYLIEKNLKRQDFFDSNDVANTQFSGTQKERFNHAIKSLGQISTAYGMSDGLRNIMLAFQANKNSIRMVPSLLGITLALGDYGFFQLWAKILNMVSN